MPDTFPTPQGLSAGAPGHIPADMTYWLGVKYAGQQVQGEYQKNIAEAGLRGAQAGTEQRISKYLDDPDHADFIHDVITQRGGMPWMRGGPGAPAAPAPGVVTPRSMGGAQAPTVGPPVPVAPMAPAPVAPTAPAPIIQPAPVAPLPLGAVVPPTPLQTPEQLTQSRQLRARSLPQLQTPSLLRSPGSKQVSPPALDPNQPVLPMKQDLGLGLRKGTANVKAPPGKGGKASKAGGMPKGLEAILPMLLAAQQGGQGAGGGPAPAPGGLPGGQPPPGAGGAGLRKGSANVKGKGGKAAGSGKAGGLEAILPALMAASQAGQMGGGAVGPQAASGNAPPMAPGAAAPPGFAQGVVNVRRYADGTSDVSINDAMPPGFAYGAPDAQPNPGYPFGAGYLFGATAVPGRGSGTVDKVPAMLAPHEAVLNRAAADSLGRGRIAALNAQGARQMGMGRGLTR